jgi:hypothetical protein
VNSASDSDSGGTEFERRTRELLVSSVDRLSGTTRSRLTQARYAAIAAASSRGRYRLQRWAPAGAAVAAALALLVVFVPHGMHSPINPVSNSALEDLDLLASDVPLNADQDVDYDFYEWAVDQAHHGASSTPRSPGTPSAGV